MTAVLAAGARVVAVEHGRDGEPVPGGLRYPGIVERVVSGKSHAWACIRYDDPETLGTGLDPYDAETGIRWEGPRWQLEPEAAG